MRHTWPCAVIDASGGGRTERKKECQDEGLATLPLIAVRRPSLRQTEAHLRTVEDDDRGPRGGNNDASIDHGCRENRYLRIDKCSVAAIDRSGRVGRPIRLRSSK